MKHGFTLVVMSVCKMQIWSFENPHAIQVPLHSEKMGFGML
jgi:hypothetical protein